MRELVAPIFPLAIIINIILLTIKDWVDKYVFYRRAALPNYLGPKMQKTMMPQLELMILFYYIGNLYMGIFLPFESEEDSEMVIFFVFIGAAMLIIYFFAVNLNCFARKMRLLEKISYDEAKDKFLTDYDTENPITKEKALAKLIKENKVKSKLNTFDRVNISLDLADTSQSLDA